MIGILQNQAAFEQDIRSLLMAFYPGEPITTDSNKVFEKSIELEFEENTLTVYAKFPDRPIRKQTITIDSSNRTKAKNALKRLLYHILQEEAGKSLPWGILTGIRPARIAMGLLETGMSPVQVKKHMKAEYQASDEKLDLCVEIAGRERQILRPIDYQDGYSLYIGIPFCPTTCLYCSFTSYPIGRWERKMDQYIDAVSKEIDYISRIYSHKKLNTIYFGGGTPTSLPADDLDQLLTKVVNSFDLGHLQEFTVEAGRPDSITKEKLEILKKHPVTRISINPQTMKQETLDIIGRRHTAAQVRDTFSMAREQDFTNINMDIIIGLPNETIEDVRNTLEEIKVLSPDSLTVHSLAVKRAAGLKAFKENYEDLKLTNHEAMTDLAAKYAEDMCLKPYYLYRLKNMAGNLENVGYAKEGKAGIYNILIMEEKQTIIAIGAGAISKVVFPKENRLERIVNVKDVDLYISRIDEMIERKAKILANL